MGVQEMSQRRVARGLPILSEKVGQKGSARVLSKLHSAPALQQTIRRREISLLDLFHTDLGAPIEASLESGAVHFITFIDEFSNCVTFFRLSRTQMLRSFIFVSKKWLSDKLGDIFEHFEVTEEENYFLEALWITSALVYLDMTSELLTPVIWKVYLSVLIARYSILIDKCFNINRSTRHFDQTIITWDLFHKLYDNSYMPGCKTPYHLWQGRTNNNFHFHVFEPNYWYQIMITITQKLDNKSLPAIFIGYPDRTEA